MINNNITKLVKLLTEKNETISSMESCTGGGFVNAITNIEGASNIINFSAVTYSNEYKIKMGVPKKTIEKYTVYSKETAIEMSKAISKFTGSNYGIGITGKLNKADEKNNYGKDNEVFISIYDKKQDKNYNFNIIATEKNRKDNKEKIINEIVETLILIIK